MANLKVIDNRNHKDGLEIYEDGNGKWYVHNEETDKILAVKYKYEAEYIIKYESDYYDL